MTTVIQNNNFPPNLLSIKPPIKKLYCQGVWDLAILNKSIAIVGSRRMTSYGERVIEKIVPFLVEANVTIISGMMYGVDQKAHNVCLECGGKTIAVLGWGLTWPGLGEEDKKMQKKIVEHGGILISEYEAQPPSLWMFPQRNRIVAGLAQAVLVVEAGEGSGSLITARLATKMDKKLFAIPGPITSSTSKGTNDLIKQGKAILVSDVNDILSNLNWPTQSSSLQGLTPKGLVIDLEDGIDVDELARKVKKNVQEVGTELSLLVLKGIVKEKNGKYFRI